MKTTYVLIDHENDQPKDLALLNGQPVRGILMNRCSDAPEFCASAQSDFAKGC